MTEGLILQSRCVRLQSVKDVLPVNETSLKGSWQLSRPAGSLNLNEIPCVKGKRVSVEITSIRTIKPKLLELKDFCAFFFPWCYFPLTQKPVFVSDSLKDGPWQKEEQGPRVNKKQYLDRGKHKKEVEIVRRWRCCDVSVFLILGGNP